MKKKLTQGVGATGKKILICLLNSQLPSPIFPLLHSPHFPYPLLPPLPTPASPPHSCFPHPLSTSPTRSPLPPPSPPVSVHQLVILGRNFPAKTRKIFTPYLHLMCGIKISMQIQRCVQLGFTHPPLWARPLQATPLHPLTRQQSLPCPLAHQLQAAETQK